MDSHYHVFLLRHVSSWTKISKIRLVEEIFNKNANGKTMSFDFEFRFLGKIYIFDQNFDLFPRISIFGQHFDF